MNDPPAPDGQAPGALGPDAAGPAPACPACGATLRLGAGFCATCGHAVGAPPPPHPHGAWLDVRYVLVFYMVLLAGQVATAILVAADVALLTVLLAADALLAVVTLATLARSGAIVLPAYRRLGFGPIGYAVVLAVSYPAAFAVSRFVGLLESTFHLHVPGIEELLRLGTGWSVLFLCVTPPLFEELAFRGTMYGLLERRLGVRDAIVISSFAFALLHLSVASLVTHVPLGLYFCWLRVRSRSMYPAMLAHLLHNGWVLLDGRWGVLS
jgi:membrane protease YdiL (CAAX protease family)